MAYQQNRNILYPNGTTIYFNAYADGQDKQNTYRCKGIIARQPTEESKVYKVYVISIARTDNSPLPNKALSLLGKKIPKFPPTCTDRPADWWLQCKEWINVSDNELEVIKRKAKKQERDNG